MTVAAPGDVGGSIAGAAERPSTKQHLLLVDGDASALQLMATSLVKAGFVVTTATDGGDALAKCRVVGPDLVLSETAMAGMDGFELCRRMKGDERLRDVPFIFLTARHRSVDDKVRGLELGEDYLTKPITVREVVARIRILLEKRERERGERWLQRASLAGTLADMSVVDLIQTLEIGKKSGTVHVEDTRGRTGTMWMRDGRIVDCVVGRLSAEPAFYRLITWREGRFGIEFKPVERAECVRLPTQLLLIDAVRRMDECGRLLQQLPSADVVLQIQYRVLSERLAEIPDDVNAILRLIDGRRTLGDVIEESRYDDLTTVSAIAMLFRERILETRAAPRAETLAPGARGMHSAGAVSAEVASEPGRSVDWTAGPASAAPPPGSETPRARDVDGGVPPPRIVRFPPRRKQDQGAATGEALPPPPAAPGPQRRAIALAVLVIGVLALAVVAWTTFSNGTSVAGRRAGSATQVDPARMQAPPDSSK